MCAAFIWFVLASSFHFDGVARQTWIKCKAWEMVMGTNRRVVWLAWREEL